MMPAASAPKGNGAARIKVKTGCGTCKSRKLKCDEGFPICRRCSSSGRVCSGYRIWGGGSDPKAGNDQVVALACTSGRKALRTRYVSPFDATCQEGELYDWLKCRVVTKLPGSFVSDFWTLLLMQAALSEPAVKHAAMAVASLHKDGVLNPDRSWNDGSAAGLDRAERVSLRHYVKSITCLQPYFSTETGASFRVALITCLIFITFELLRGHFPAAQIHLENGLKLLRESQRLPKDENIVITKASRNGAVDDWIVEAFIRFHVQIEVFMSLYQHRTQFVQIAQPDRPEPTFRSFRAAWVALDRSLIRVLHLMSLTRENDAASPTPPHDSAQLLHHHVALKQELDEWQRTFEASRALLGGPDPSSPLEKAKLLLRVHHTMAQALLAASLHPNDESVFDSHTHFFRRIMEELTSLWLISVVGFTMGRFHDMSRFIVDAGAIQPLYYVAVKCRDHKIRLQAVRLLESMFHREGIWDARLTAKVARKVMELEERDFYKSCADDDDCPIGTDLTFDRPPLPALPMSFRIREPEMVFSGDALGTVFLMCKQKRDGGDCRVLLAEFCFNGNSWTDQ